MVIEGYNSFLNILDPYNKTGRVNRTDPSVDLSPRWTPVMTELDRFFDRTSIDSWADLCEAMQCECFMHEGFSR